MSSRRSSAGFSRTVESDNQHSWSITSNSTTNTSAEEFLAAVATEPPREELWKGYTSTVAPWPSPTERPLEDSHDFPPLENLVEAGNIPLLDADGNEVSFRSLCLGDPNAQERRLFLFIRHWYCRACQGYVKDLQSLAPNTAQINGNDGERKPTRIVLVGCGAPSLIEAYTKRTGCPYPVYTDPTLRLLKLLGCRRWGGIVYRFGKRPEYTGNMNAFCMSYRSLLERYQSLYTDSLSGEESSESSDQAFRSLTSIPTWQPGLRKRVSTEGLRSGPIFQVGGEFLFEQGNLIWCHRMKGMRSHTEVKTLRRVLDITDGSDSMEERLETKWVREELEEHQRQGRTPPKQLRKKAEELSQLHTESINTSLRALPLVSDEEEDRYLEHQLGRKASTTQLKGKVQVVREPNSPKAHLERNW